VLVEVRPIGLSGSSWLSLDNETRWARLGAASPRGEVSHSTDTHKPKYQMPLRRSPSATRLERAYYTARCRGRDTANVCAAAAKTALRAKNLSVSHATGPNFGDAISIRRTMHPPNFVGLFLSLHVDLAPVRMLPALFASLDSSEAPKNKKEEPPPPTTNPLSPPNSFPSYHKPSPSAHPPITPDTTSRLCHSRSPCVHTFHSSAKPKPCSPSLLSPTFSVSYPRALGQSTNSPRASDPIRQLDLLLAERTAHGTNPRLSSLAAPRDRTSGGSQF